MKPWFWRENRRRLIRIPGETKRDQGKLKIDRGGDVDGDQTRSQLDNWGGAHIYKYVFVYNIRVLHN